MAQSAVKHAGRGKRPPGVLTFRRSTKEDPATPSGDGQNQMAGPIWNREDYPRLEPGMRLVCGAKIQGPEWVRRYSRWSLRIEFDLVYESGVVSAFFNLGKDREAQRAPRNSKYYKAWILANGDSPRQGEQMLPEVFLDKHFEVMVEDCKQDSEGSPKEEGEIYSRITKFHKVVTP